MTDNEIIKALETCNSPYSDYKCVSCPLYDTESNCKTALTVVALDLITRQKAEIEELKLENRVLSQNRITMPERLEIVNNARDKAIREFANRLKCGVSITSGRITCDDIDNLVKEMTEGENG